MVGFYLTISKNNATISLQILENTEQKIETMKVIIVGIGKFGKKVLQFLSKEGQPQNKLVFD